MSDETQAKPEDDAETPDEDAAAPGEPEDGAEDAAEDGAEDETEDGAEDGAPQSPVGKLVAKLKAHLKLILIVVGALVVVGGGAAGIYFSGIFHVEKPHEATLMLPAPPINHEMTRITVDLKPSPKHARPFIRLTMRAELQGESARDAFIANETKIMDAIHAHLRDTTIEQLEGHQGTETLREDITIIINRVIAPEIAITVLYKDILIR